LRIKSPIKSLSRNYIYVGMTSDLKKRLQRHNAGLEKTTQPYAPFNTIYTKECTTRKEARALEKSLKTTSGKRFLRKFIDLPR
jgi:putative endonuclease